MYRIQILFLIVFGANVSAQNNNNLEQLNGIWIAEDYYNAFEKTNSALKSKKAFGFNDPVALRINTSDIKEGILSIGYSVLHDHLLHPEVSEYILKGTYTIREQDNFKINLKAKDSLGYYKTTAIHYFNYEWVSYIAWDSTKEMISIYKPKNANHKETTINYVRFKSSFSQDYQYPNPLYTYTRSKTLVGQYTLKDHTGKVLSEAFTIEENGLISGFSDLENFTIYFSTDIYCGLPASEDVIIIVEDILDHESKGFLYAYVRDQYGNISLHNGG
nr:hypothetical protein [uncultured Psychroserpens sp.]